jgi:hypothetical protein
MPAAIMVGLGCSALIRYAHITHHPGATEYNVLYGPANLCAVDRFELGRCEAMLNALGAQGWKLVGASLNYGIIFFIRE